MFIITQPKLQFLIIFGSILINKYQSVRQKSFSFKLYFWLNIIPFNIFSKNFYHLQSVKHSTETVSHNILLWLFDTNVSRAHTVQYQYDWTSCYFLPCLNDDEHWHWTLAGRLAGQHEGEQIWLLAGHLGLQEPGLDFTWIFIWKNTQLALDFRCFWNIKQNQKHNATRTPPSISTHSNASLYSIESLASIIIFSWTPLQQQ